VGGCALKKLNLLRGVGAVLLAGFLAAVLPGCNDATGPTPASTNAVPSASSSTAVATLSWEAPTSNTNGTPLTDLNGYRIYYGSNANDLSQSVQITSAGIQTYVIDNLPAGTWYFAIMAVTSAGTESALSNIVSETIG
jgi:hypothetical protein